MSDKPEIIPNEAPKRVPPITSVVQCSPRYTRDTSIAPRNPKRTVCNTSRTIPWNLNVTKNKAMKTRYVVLVECPDGYE